MRLCIQRVRRATVTVDGAVTGSIGQGLMILVGVGQGDTEADADRLADRCLSLRIFEDAAGKINLSVKDISGRVLAVSQFTLYADTSRGNRPGFSQAAPPDSARALYDRFCERIKTTLGDVQKGVFGASMQVELVNDGPVTIVI